MRYCAQPIFVRSPVKLMYTAGKISMCPVWKITCPVGHVATKVNVPWDKIYMSRACGHALMSSPDAQNAQGIILQNEFENHTFGITATSSRGQWLKSYMLNCFDEIYICMLHICSIQKWHNQLKSILIKCDGLVILQSQYHDYWWHGDARSQGISRCGFDQACAKYLLPTCEMFIISLCSLRHALWSTIVL